MKKTLALLPLAFAVALAACGKKEEAPAAAAPAPAVVTKIVVGLDDNFPPMGFRDEKGAYTGHRPGGDQRAGCGSGYTGAG